MGFSKLEKDVLNISKLPNSVKGNAEQLKKTFDKAGEDIKEAHNKLIDELAEQNAASNIGAMSEEGATTVQAELDKLNDRIHVDFTELEIEVDDELSLESENAVQNKVITRNIVDKELIEKINMPETEVEIQKIEILDPVNDTAYKVFDESVSTYINTTSVPLIVDLGEEITPKMFMFYLYGTSVTILIEGSKDLNDWETLYSETSSDYHAQSTAMPLIDKKCRYIKVSGIGTLYMFNIVAWEKNGAIINGNYIPKMSNNICEIPKLKLNLNIPIEAYKDNQIVNIMGVGGILIGKDYEEIEFTSNPFPAFTSMAITYDDKGYPWQITQGSGYDNNTGWKAFDKNSNTNFQTLSSTSYGSASINAKKLGNAIALVKPKKISLSVAGVYTGFQITGEKTDGTVERLYTHDVAEGASISKEIEINTDSYFQKISVSSAGKAGSPSYIYDVQIIEGTLRYGIQEDITFDSCSNASLTINGLEEIPIEGELIESKEYELIYSNKKWNAQRKYKIIRGFYPGSAGTSTSETQPILLGYTPEVLTVWKSASTQFVKLMRSDSDAYFYDTATNIKIIDGGFNAIGSSSSGFNAKGAKYYYEAWC